MNESNENKEITQEINESELRQDRLIAGREQLVRTLKPFGCFLVLFCFVSMLALCFSTGREPVKGYAPPESSEYYAGHLDELKAELEANLFPYLEGVTGCEEADGVLEIVIESDSYVTTRAAVIRYYDRELFSFIQAEE